MERAFEEKRGVQIDHNWERIVAQGGGVTVHVLLRAEDDLLEKGGP